MDNSPLQRLPGELRNRIYELTLFVPDGVQISLLHSKPKAVRERIGWITTPVPISGLPHTCNAIRKESLQTFSAINSFQFTTSHFDQGRSANHWIESLRSWVGMLGEEQLTQITEINISLGTWTCSTGRANPRFHMKHMRTISNLFHSDTEIEMTFRANLRCPAVDVLDLSFPLGRPIEALLAAHEKHQSIRRHIEATFVNPLSRCAYLEVFTMSYKVLEHLISQMVDLF